MTYCGPFLCPAKPGLNSTDKTKVPGQYPGTDVKGKTVMKSPKVSKIIVERKTVTVQVRTIAWGAVIAFCVGYALCLAAKTDGANAVDGVQPTTTTAQIGPPSKG